MLDPLIILLIGLVIVLGAILVLRINAFLALICAAFTISFLIPNPAEQSLWNFKIARVLSEFGIMAGKISILVVMGAIIGKAMLESRAADRIIIAICRLFGEKRVPASLLSAGFVLSIPVFYDSTFYLLVPLARSFYKRVRKNHILLLTAIGAGATITHTLVPPTPGPLITAKELGLSIAPVMLTGAMVGSLLAPFALLGCYFVNWYMPNPRIVDHTLLEEDENEQSESLAEREKELPTLFASLVPVFLPVICISCASILSMMESGGKIPLFDGAIWNSVRNAMYVIGDANIALSFGAFVASMIMLRQRKFSLSDFNAKIESALIDAGMIILITSAGGAFGAMIRVGGVGERIRGLVETDAGLSGIAVLILAFGTAAVIKTAQGSSTTAMITTSSIIGSMAISPEVLGFHPAYLATTIGLGSMVVGWMNDSGFWVFCRLGGIHEIDAMKTWTVLLGLMGTVGLLIVIVLTRFLPLSSLA